MNIALQAREIQPLRQTFGRVAAYTGDKPASRYLEATLGVQPTEHFHYRPTWEQGFEIYDTRRTAIVLEDWNVLRDPRQFYYASWTIARARQQEAMEANYQFVESRGLAQKMPGALREQALRVLMPLRHVAWGGNMNNCDICARGYGTPFTAPAMFHAMDQLGVAQYLTRLGLALHEPGTLEAGRNAWLDDPVWQPLRRLVEDTLVLKDPMELFVAQNLALDGQLYPLIFSHYVDDHLALRGAAAVAMLTSFIPEWHMESSRWVDAVVKTASGESGHAEHNSALLTHWYLQWADRATQALEPVALQAFGAQESDAHTQVLAQVRAGLDARVRKTGLAV